MQPRTHWRTVCIVTINFDCRHPYTLYTCATPTPSRSMFIGRQYKRVSQQGDSDSGDTTDNETAFFTSESGSRIWRMGTRPSNLNTDPELDLPYVHPTLPVEMKKNKSLGHYTRRQLVSGACLLFMILAMVAAFAVAIILGQKYIVDAPPTNNENDLQVTTHVLMPTPDLMNFDPFESNTPSITPDYTGVAMVTSSPTTKPISTTHAMITTITTIETSSPIPAPEKAEPIATTERTNAASNEREVWNHLLPQTEPLTKFRYKTYYRGN